MYYYEVYVASNRYHGQGSLVYSSDKKIAVGRVVEVSLRSENCLGLIKQQTIKPPKIKIKQINSILDLPSLPKTTLQTIEWLQNYYAAPIGLVCQLFLPQSLPAGKLKVEAIKGTSGPPMYKLPVPTAEQIKILKTIDKPGSYLLHGETGSGKTRIYQELAKRSIEKGQSVIILVPEIGLSAQLESQFRNLFGNKVIVIHSQLTEKRRREAWLECLLAKEPLVVLGPRSALFSPLKSIGLIVLDEAHDSAYKQDQNPHYHAIRLASYIASENKAQLVLGTATPNIADYYYAEQKKVPILRMKSQALKQQEKAPLVEIVDLKDRSQFTKSQVLSSSLINAIEAALNKQEQVLLYLNQRGTARVILCSNCGWRSLCPNCDSGLIYHGDNHILRCHGCGYKTKVPLSCPVCSSTDIIFKGTGTKALETEVRRLFPEKIINRYDTDNKKHERFERQYESIASGKVDILIGTQILAKGLDLPRLSVVGIVIADTALYLPDFTAQENLYQLTYQVLGRISRGHREGTAVIQTYDPDNATLLDAISRNYIDFYKSELAERRRFMFPPFCFMLKLRYRGRQIDRVEKAVRDLSTVLRQNNKQAAFSDPAPAFYEKVGNNYEWHIVVKAKQRQILLDIISQLPGNWSYDIDPVNLL